MLNPFFDAVNALDGFLFIALVDRLDGSILEHSFPTGCTYDDHSDFDWLCEQAAGLLRLKLALLKRYGEQDYIENIITTYTDRYHIIYPLSTNDTLFLYAQLCRERSTLASFYTALASFDQKLNFFAY